MASLFKEHRLAHVRAEIYNTSSRPSARVLRSQAVSDTPEQQSNNGRYRPMVEANSANASAVAQKRLKKEHPELFVTEAELRAQALATATAQGLVGGRRADFVNSTVETKLRNMKYTRDSLLDKYLTTANDQVATREGNRYAIDPSRRYNVSAKEAALRAEIEKADPSLKSKFTQYLDWLGQLDSLDEEDRKKALKEIEDEAETAIAPFYDEQGRFLQREDALNREARRFSKESKLADAEKIRARGSEDLSRETGSTLTDSFLSLRGRGGADSGIENTLANEIIDASMRGRGRLQEDYNINKSRAETEFDLQDRMAQLNLEQDQSKLGRERTKDFNLEIDDIMGDMERWNYLIGGDAASQVTDPLKEVTKPRSAKDEILSLRSPAQRLEQRITNRTAAGETLNPLLVNAARRKAQRMSTRSSGSPY